MKTIIVVMSFLISSISLGQGYKVKKLDLEDGLINDNIDGVFQDEYGIIWVLNGGGYTRFFGDHSDQIKNEKIPNRIPSRTINGKFYWPGRVMSDGTIRIINKDLKRNATTYVAGEDQKTFHLITDPYVDKYGYYWSSYTRNDSNSVVRIKGKDTLDLVSVLANYGLEYEYRHFTIGIVGTKFSRPQNFIEDAESNVWFNTVSGKLMKVDFDQKRIIHYGNISNVSGVVIDNKRGVWVTKYQTYDELNPKIYLLKEEGQTEYYESEGEARIYVGPNEEVYLLDEAGVKILKGDNFQLLPNTENIQGIWFNSNGEVIAAKFQNDSTIFGHYTEERFYSLVVLDYPSINILVDREGIVWIPSDEGLYRCTPSDLTFTSKENNILANNKERVDFLGDPNNNKGVRFYKKWIFGEEHQAIIFAEKHGEVAKVLSSISGISSGLEWPTIDQNGNLYITEVSHYIRKHRVTYSSRFENLYKITPELEVHSLVNGDLTDLKGVDIESGWQIKVLNDEIFLFTKRGTYVMKENEEFKLFPIDTTGTDEIWVGFNNDLDFHLFSKVYPPNEKYSRTDQWGNTYGAIETIKYDLETHEYSIFECSNDSLSFTRKPFLNYGNDGWICFMDSNIIIKDDELTYVDYPQRSSDKDVKLYKGFCEPIIDREGNVFYDAQEGGLVKFNPKEKSFVEKTIEDGLESNSYKELFIGPSPNQIWLRSDFALERVELSSFDEGTKIKSKSWLASDGYKDSKFIEFIGDSLLIMETRQKRLKINLDFTNFTNEKPNIYFKKVTLNNDFDDWEKISSNVVYDENIMPNEMELDYDQNHLTFYFQGVSQISKFPIQYEYKLAGLQNNWIKTQNKSVSYPDLDPGDYEFQVKAVNEIGESEPISIKFHIAKPWYQTTLARIVFVLLILGGFFAFFRVRTAALRRRQIVLENKVDEATVEIKKQKEAAEHQRDLVEEKNQEIMDSITYAKRLQTAILPPQKLVKEWLNDSFIFYKPKDIVAGDFYWMETTKRNGRSVVFYAAADCTGHGVPGAMVSVVCSNALKRAIKEFDISDPGQLLDKVAEIVQESFEQSEHEVKDGMDIAVCAIDLLDRKVWFSGAHNSLYRITGEDTKVPEGLKVLESGNRKLIEYTANKQPVGAFEHMEPFKTIEIQLEPGDCIYLFSDGFADQFGGEKGKKFKYKPFKQLLLDIEDKEMDSQKDILDTEFERWKGSLEQVDDVCIIGLRVNGHMRKLFSKRELEVIQKIKEGRQSKEIADEMEIAKSTVDTYRKRILAKTNLNNAAELIKFCDEHEVL